MHTCSVLIQVMCITSIYIYIAYISMRMRIRYASWRVIHTYIAVAIHTCIYTIRNVQKSIYIRIHAIAQVYIITERSTCLFTTIICYSASGEYTLIFTIIDIIQHSMLDRSYRFKLHLRIQGMRACVRVYACVRVCVLERKLQFYQSFDRSIGK